MIYRTYGVLSIGQGTDREYNFVGIVEAGIVMVKIVIFFFDFFTCQFFFFLMFTNYLKLLF